MVVGWELEQVLLSSHLARMSLVGYVLVILMIEDEGLGTGRIMTLDKPATLSELVERVKKSLSLEKGTLHFQLM